MLQNKVRFVYTRFFGVTIIILDAFNTEVQLRNFRKLTKQSMNY